MKSVFYPAIFHKAEEGGFWISFPDFPECFTQGEEMADAYEMAKSALSLSLEEFIGISEFPTPTPVNELKYAENEYIVIIEYNLQEHMRKYNSKAVKKTLTIPKWLNEMAIEKDVNFSAVLQDALKEKLNIL